VDPNPPYEPETLEEEGESTLTHLLEKMERERRVWILAPLCKIVPKMEPWCMK